MMRARIRTIKPGFFQHEELFDLEAETGLPVRVAYIGLWCWADREGLFEWRPRILKANILPHDHLDFSRVLDALWTRGFLVKYACDDGRSYGWIPTFRVHQALNNRESQSTLPAPTDDNITPCEGATSARVGDVSATRAARGPGDARARASGMGMGMGMGMEEESPNGDSPKSAAPIPDLWAVYLDELGGTPPHPRLTDRRRQVLRALYDEHLSHVPDPCKAFRAILRRVKASEFHLSKREYQMPESLFRNEDRRDRWARGHVGGEDCGGDLPSALQPANDPVPLGPDEDLA